MPAISSFIKAQKSKYIQARKWLPILYYVDATDKHLCHPDIELLQIADKVCKYLYAGATFESSAKWLTYHAEKVIEKRKEKDPDYNVDIIYNINKESMKVFYRRWLKTRTENAVAARVKNEKKIKKDINARFGNSIETVGFDTVQHKDEESSSTKVSA